VTRPDDRERIVKAFRVLDPRSIYLRFLFHKKELRVASALRTRPCAKLCWLRRSEAAIRRSLS